MNAPAIIVQARMTSRRLPGKVLRSLAGRPMLAYTLDRLSLCKAAGALVVATSTERSDDPVAAFVEASGLRCLRGSLDDVAGRFVHAAASVGAESLVRISADSPFIDPEIVDRAIALYRADDCDLVTNVFPRSFPRGMSVEVMRTKALEEVCARKLEAADREHVTRYFYEHPDDFSIVNFTHAPDLSEYVLTVDEMADFGRAERLIAGMAEPHTSYGLDRLIALYDRLAGPKGTVE